MSTDLLSKVRQLPDASLAREPLASFLALEIERHDDPKWLQRRRDAKAADRRWAMMYMGIVLLSGLVLLAMPHVAPGLVHGIAALVFDHFGALCAAMALGVLSGLALYQSRPDLPENWGDALICSCLLVGITAGSLMLVAAISMI